MVRICRAAVASLALLLSACGGGGQPGSVLPDGGTACTKNSQCPSGQGCVSGGCQALPCGGCQPDEACADTGQCVAAQGAGCPQAGCPTGYSCTGSFCAKPCTLDADCPSKSVCNSSLGKCAQCTFDTQCAGVTGKPRCDGSSGTCVACTQPIDCPHGNFCDTTAHTCTPGCKVTGDCNVAIGEKCDTTAGTPGRCIQCAVDNDCKNTDGTSTLTPACDPTGHCVACTADKYCPLGTPRCETTSKTCVQCLASNNATGTDCGVIAGATTRDAHDARTCNAATHSCVDGCQFDTQCGCPRDASGNETNCGRYPHSSCLKDSDCNKVGTTGNTCVGANATTVGVCKNGGASVVIGAEHCDPALTKNGDNAASLGACAECVKDPDPADPNKQCRYRVLGATGATNYGGSFAALNGSRCVNDVCVEGCDSNTDCPASKICHLSSNVNDPNRNKCVSCSCDGATLTDLAWCNDGANCPNDSGGPRVCDSATLSCRHKRFNETCSHTNECGDTHDPAV